MTATEFSKAILYLSAGLQRKLDDAATEVYFDALRDLPAAPFLAACKLVLLNHVWATFPTVAELSGATANVIRGNAMPMCGAKGWEIAWRVARDTDPEVDGSFERAIKKHKAPPAVIEAIRCFGLNSLCYGNDPVGVIRGQFMKTFEQIAESERQTGMLPPSLRAEIEAMPDTLLVQNALAGIGKEIPQ